MAAMMMVALVSVVTAAHGKEVNTANDVMTNVYLGQLIRRIDKNAQGDDGHWQFKVEDVTVTVLTDEKADRMRIIAPIAKAASLNKEMMKRLMQANFDSALDARYAVAKGVLWSAYIHPLSPLDAKQFLEGVGQVVNLKVTFGSSFSSGAMLFNGGDSKALQRKMLIERLLQKGLAI